MHQFMGPQIAQRYHPTMEAQAQAFVNRAITNPADFFQSFKLSVGLLELVWRFAFICAPQHHGKHGS